MRGDELTPKVRAGIAALLDELGRVEGELDERRRRIAGEEPVGADDPLAPVVGRRTFIRELSRAIAYGRRYRTPGSIAYLHIDNLAEAAASHGAAGADAMLRHVALLLTQSVRKSDIVGRLADDAFAVVLARADAHVAAAKTRALAARVTNTPLRLDGETIAVRVSSGSHTFPAGCR